MNWNEIFRLLKDEPEFTLEAIGTLQLITSILQSNDLTALSTFDENPYILVLKNNQKIGGGLENNLENNVAINDLQQKALQYQNNLCDKLYPKYYVHTDMGEYRYFGIFWKSPENQDYLIVYRINTKRNETRIKQQRQTIQKQKRIGFIVSFIVWLLLIWIINGFSLKHNLVDYIVYIVIGLAISYFNTTEIIAPASYESEINNKSELNGRSLAIASVAIGLSFVLSYVQFKESNLYLRYILFAFILGLLALLVPNNEKTGRAVRWGIVIQASILNISIAILILACYTYFKSIFQNTK